MTIDLEAELARARTERDAAIGSRDQALRAVDAVVETLREHLAGDVSRTALRIALVHFARGDSRKLRYTHARRIAEGAVADRDDGPYTLLDCASGDLTALNLAIGAPESNPDYAPDHENTF